MATNNETLNNGTTEQSLESQRSCQEFQTLERRRFLDSTKAIALAALTSPAWLPRVAKAAGGRAALDTYVQIFLRGGMDGLTLCVPHGDPELYLARPNLAIPKPGDPNGAIDLDGFFGFPQAAAPLMTPWTGGHLAVVHATGSTDPTRSHFDAERFVEYGNPNGSAPNANSGWLGRHLNNVPPPLGGGILRGMAIADFTPYSLIGAPLTVPVAEPENFDFPGNPATAVARRAAVSDMYTATDEPLKGTALNTLDTIDLLASIDFDNYQPANGAVYPNTFFGQALKKTAALIKANKGVECIQVDLGGWDTHALQGPINGYMYNLMQELTLTLEAFYTDMLAFVNNYTLAALSEFGRRVEENGSAGTDHGHGNCMLVMGGNVNGGQVFANWPTLAPPALDEGDLVITTDYRDVLGEIAKKRLGDNRLKKLFPNHTFNFPGVVV